MTSSVNSLNENNLSRSCEESAFIFKTCKVRQSFWLCGVWCGGWGWGKKKKKPCQKKRPVVAVDSLGKAKTGSISLTGVSSALRIRPVVPLSAATKTLEHQQQVWEWQAGLLDKKGDGGQINNVSTHEFWAPSNQERWSAFTCSNLRQTVSEGLLSFWSSQL